MALRIGDYVRAGELRNSRRNGVHGWIEFATDYGIRLELTGNFVGELQGRNLRFKVPDHPDSKFAEPGEFPDSIETLADRQIGVVGDISMRTSLVPTVPTQQFLEMTEAEQQRHLVEKRCLHIEWHSQNGSIVAELREPEIEFYDDSQAALDDVQQIGDIDSLLGLDGSGPGDDLSAVPEFLLHDDEEDDEDEDENDESENPYGLFDENLDRKVAESLGPSGQPDFDEDLTQGPPKLRPWDEVIPGIDPETKAMYEQWDEIFEGKKDEPLSYLFNTPLKLPKPDAVTSDGEAQPLVTAILAQLALLSVALDVCEHFTPLDTYRVLMSDILPTAKVHPNLAATDMVQHYSTSDYCSECEAEFEAEFGDTNDSDSDSDEDSQDDAN